MLLKKYSLVKVSTPFPQCKCDHAANVVVALTPMLSPLPLQIHNIVYAPTL